MSFAALFAGTAASSFEDSRFRWQQMFETRKDRAAQRQLEYDRIEATKSNAEAQRKHEMDMACDLAVTARVRHRGRCPNG